MRDAAGELSERLQPLAMLQRLLGFHSPGRLGMETARSPQRQRQDEEQQCGGRQAENQMLAHGGEPARADRRGLEPGADIDRILREPLIAEAALDAVGRRGHGDEAGLRVGGELLSDGAVAVEPEIAVEHGKAGQHRAVGEAEREEAAGIVADPRVEILEIFRKHGSLDHAGKAAVVGLPAAADAEERRALIGRTRLQRLADENPDIPVDMGLEVVAIGKIDLGGGQHQAVDQRAALRVENPGRLHLRQRVGELLQPRVQRFLARPDVGVRNAADDLVDLRQAAVDGLEHLQRVFVGDVQRAFDFPVGGVADRDPGNRRGKAEQRNREGQRGGHHPLQQSQRIALLGLHGRSDFGAELTANLAVVTKRC